MRDWAKKGCDSAIYVESFCILSSVILRFWCGIALYFVAMRGIALMSSLREVGTTSWRALRSNSPTLANPKIKIIRTKCEPILAPLRGA